MENKILIIPGNTDLNRGDQALVWESIKLIADLKSPLKVYLYNSGANQKEAQLQKSQTSLLGYHFIDRILLHPKVKSGTKHEEINYSIRTKISWGLIAFKDLCVTLMLISKFNFLNKIGTYFLSKAQKKSLNVFSNLDILVVKGGGFLHSYGKFTDAYVMYYFLFDVFLAKKYRIKTIILPNSIGPLKNKLAKWISRKALNTVDFISVREEVSAQFLTQELNITSKVYPDLGFYQKSKKFNVEELLQKKGFDKKELNIAVTLRPYRFDGHQDAKTLYQNYIDEVAHFVTAQLALGRKISFIAHTLGPSAHEDDRIAIKDVFNKLSRNNRSQIIYFEDYNLDCRELQYLYGQFDFLLGTRFHSVIFALNEHIPSLAIAYGGNKSFGIMKDIGIGQFVIGIEKVNSKWLIDQMDLLINTKEDYLKKLCDFEIVINRCRQELQSDLQKLLNDK